MVDANKEEIDEEITRLLKTDRINSQITDSIVKSYDFSRNTKKQVESLVNEKLTSIVNEWYNSAIQNAKRDIDDKVARAVTNILTDKIKNILKDE